MSAWMAVHPKGHWWLRVVLRHLPYVDGPAQVLLTITQPHGYHQRTEHTVAVHDGSAEFEILYPLVDEGRFEGPETIWEDRSYADWPSGEYCFTARVDRNGMPAHVVQDTLPVKRFFMPAPGEGTVRNSPHQFIECAPLRPILIDHDLAEFQIRVLPDRVPRCEVMADVVLAGTDTPLAGPWRLDLGGQAEHQSFSTLGWPRADYWIRVRALWGGEPTGPYCVRLFTKEVSRIDPLLEEVGHRVGTSPVTLTDSTFFEEAAHVRFVPDLLELKPDGPLVQADRPWEGEYLAFSSLRRDVDRRRYELIYTSRAWSPTRAQALPEVSRYKYLAISDDGLTWEKPELGRISFNGSTANNILEDRPGKHISAKRDTTSDEARRDLEFARFRFYDRNRDGPVNLDNVFVVSGRSGFPVNCKSVREAADSADPTANDGFRPKFAEYWPFEKRGDEYLVLTRHPVLYRGVGQNLMHTTEVFRFHVEVVPAKRLYYYYRPTPPGYPPHNAPYDNLPRGRRCIAVLWTEDGLTWHRRFALSPDEFDEPGTVLYTLRVLAPEGSGLRAAEGRPALSRRYYPVLAVPEMPMYLGTVQRYSVITGHLSPELVWSYDLVRWHRFTAERRPMIELGPPGAYNWGWARDDARAEAYTFEGEWWLPYSASNGLHSYPAALRFPGTLEEFKEQHAYYAQLPHFRSWDDLWREVKSSQMYPALARCKEGRVAHAEPTGGAASLTSKPIVAGGENVVINAAVAAGGSVRAELRNERNQALVGYALSDCAPFSGDDTAHTIRWGADSQRSSREPLTGRTVRLHFQLDHARLYTFSFGA